MADLLSFGRQNTVGGDDDEQELSRAERKALKKNKKVVKKDTSEEESEDEVAPVVKKTNNLAINKPQAPKKAPAPIPLADMSRKERCVSSTVRFK